MKQMFAGRHVSLAQLTVSGSSPIDVVRAAAATGFDGVGLRLEARLADEATGTEAASDVSQLAGLRRECQASGVAVSNVTGRYLVPDTCGEDLERLVEAGATLGARYVVAVSGDPNMARATDNLARLGELAAKAGMDVALEFITYNQVRSFPEADGMAIATGNPRVGLMIDAIHLSRSGGTPADIANARSPIHVLQLCDARGPAPQTRDDRVRESRTARLYPGEGDLPLAQLVRMVPEQCHLEVEAPRADHLNLNSVSRARFAADATRSFIRGLELPA